MLQKFRDSNVIVYFKDIALLLVSFSFFLYLCGRVTKNYEGHGRFIFF